MAVPAKYVLSLLLDRPGEPIFMPKGQEKVVALDVPDKFLRSRHRGIKKKLQKKWQQKGTQIIPIKNVTVPDLSEIKLSRNKMFTFFSEQHQEIAGKLIDIFLKQKNADDLLSVAAYCHERVNPYLFNYSLSVALLHRKDTKGVTIPNYFQCFPGKFLPSTATIQARQEATVIPKDVRQAIVIPQNFTANLLEPEQRVAYFREDIGINSHHWHWHLVYPTGGADQVVNKDRRGELFYYMHQQCLARYNTERQCNNLPRVKPFKPSDLIPEGYFSKLVQGIANRSWTPRFANIKCQDINRVDEESPDESTFVKISELNDWEAKILQAINNGYATDAQGNQVSLLNDKGIDVLGNLVESTILSINRPTYGHYHNRGHLLIAFCHDPDGRYEEDAAVMGDTATAMRDPVFYKWHSHINDIFVSLKDKPAPYLKDELTFKDVEVKEFKISAEGKPDNEFHTFWKESEVDFSIGLDFVPLGPVKIRFTHLNHEPFAYSLTINNTSNKEKSGYARVFIALKKNADGTPMEFNEQRKLMIELDKFRVVLQKGTNKITRKSAESTVTIPFERTFESIRTDNFCGCGWPQHMLIPKGTVEGTELDMFVMISDYSVDIVEQDIVGLCNDAESYCGIRDRKYPDKKPMGFPFDRKAAPAVRMLADFVTPNMKVQSGKIKFTDKIVGKKEDNPNVSVVPARQ